MTRFALLVSMVSLNALALEAYDARFNIQLPDGATVHDTREKTPLGDVVGKTWEASLGDDFLSFTYSDYPKALAQASAPTEHLKNAVSGFLKGSKAKLTKQTPFVLTSTGDSAHGVDVESVGTGVHFQLRIVMAGTRLYMLVFGRSDLSHTTEPFDQAKASFALIGYSAAADARDPIVVSQPTFSIVMPFTTTDGPAEKQPGIRNGHTWEAEVGETFLSFTHLELAAPIAPAGVSALLKKMAAESVKNTKATVREQTPVQLKLGGVTVPALDLEASTAQGIIFMSRFMVLGNHQYTLVYARPETEPSTKLFEAAARSLILK